MAKATYPAPITSEFGATLALSTSLASYGLPPQYHQVLLAAESGSAFRYHLNPALLGAVFYDASADAGSRCKQGGTTGNLVNDLADNDTATGTAAIMDAATTSDFLYLGFADAIAGMRVVIGSANVNASVLTVKYRKSDGTWANITATDGTISPAGTSLGATGSITWAVPTDWQKAQLGGHGGILTDGDAPAIVAFWLQLSWSLALSADVEIDDLWSLHKNTNRSYCPAGQALNLSLDRSYIGAIEAILTAGTDTLDINPVRTTGA